MLSGKLTRIVVHVDLQPIAEELHGDYKNMISAVSSIFDSLEKEGKQHD